MSQHGNNNFDFQNAFQQQGTLDFNQWGAPQEQVALNNFAAPNVDQFGLTDLNIPALNSKLDALSNNGIGGNAFGSGEQGGTFDFLTNGSAFGKDGWGVPAAQAVSGLVGAYTGLQQLKQGKEMFNFQKGVTNRNLSNQAQTVNTQLRDQYAGRFSAGTPGAAKIEDYMAKNSVNGSAI